MVRRLRVRGVRLAGFVVLSFLSGRAARAEPGVRSSSVAVERAVRSSSVAASRAVRSSSVAAAAELRATDTLRSSDWADTRLTFALSTWDLASGPGERIGASSGLRLGVDPGTTLPFENLNTRYSGFESLTHLALHRRFAGLWPRWSAEAAISLLAIGDDASGEWGAKLADAGSYVRIVRALGDGPEDRVGSIDLTAWPLSADRFRLGYTYRISWGGTAMFPGELSSSSITEGDAPGARLAWRAPEGEAYAFVGAKSALLLSRAPGTQAGEPSPAWGGLAGAGVELTDRLIAEVNGGVFDKGTQERVGLEGRAITAWGLSARLTLHDGPVLEPTSPDLQPHGGAPYRPGERRGFVPWVPGSGYSVALEGSVLRQNLEDPDTAGQEKEVTAIAAGLVARVVSDRLTLGLDAIVQSVDFLLFTVPGFVPFQALSAGAETSPEVLVALSAAYGLEALPMRPKLTLGLELPAWVKGRVSPELGGAGGALAGEVRTQVIRDEVTRVVLPAGRSARPIFGALLELPLAIAEEVTVSGELRYAYDENQPRLTTSAELGEVAYAFDRPHRLGLGLVVRAWW